MTIDLFLARMCVVRFECVAALVSYQPCAEGRKGKKKSLSAAYLGTLSVVLVYTTTILRTLEHADH